jgi:hypothetical protein
MILVGCCLLIFVVVIFLGILVIVFTFSKGLGITVALSKVDLFGVLVVVVIIKGLIVVVALGILDVIDALSILVIVIAPGVLVVVFAFGVLVVIMSLGVLIVDILGKGLIVIVVSNVNVIVIIPLGKGLLIALAMLPSSAYFDWSYFGVLNKPKTTEPRSPNIPAWSCILSYPPSVTSTCFWLVVECKISNGGHLRPSHFLYLYFFVVQFTTMNKETRPPHTLCPGCMSSPSSLLLLTLTID